MKALFSPSRDPAVNLAAEEVLLTGFSADCLLLWVSEPSVIIGKFQNPYGELSLRRCAEAGVSVYRRNSGGGTVYHDTGNLNYSFFTRKSESSPDYDRFLLPVAGFLSSLGVSAEIRDTSALFVGEKKISGNAQSVVGDRVMHHGTLLFDADLTALARLTGHAREKVVSKSIPSSPSPVTNLRPLLRENMTLDGFARAFLTRFSDGALVFTGDEERKIAALAEEKYRSWEWNFGRTPAFAVSSGDDVVASRRGVIEAASRYGELLVGCRLIPAEIERALSSLPAEEKETVLTLIFD